MLAVFDDDEDSDDGDCQINLGYSLYSFPATLGPSPGLGVSVCRVPSVSLNMELLLRLALLD